MRGEDPFEGRRDSLREEEKERRQKSEGSVRSDDKRADGGLDLGGRLPQPA
jgi:hypothetical protein